MSKLTNWELFYSKWEPRTNLSENSCHFVNLLTFASSYFFLSLRKITWLNSQDFLFRTQNETHSGSCLILVLLWKHQPLKFTWNNEILKRNPLKSNSLPVSWIWVALAFELELKAGALSMRNSPEIAEMVFCFKHFFFKSEAQNLPTFWAH